MHYKRLRELRLKNSYTQERVAQYLHVNQKTYSRYERGEHEMTAETLAKIATLYDTTVDYLIDRTDEIKNTNIKKKNHEIDNNNNIVKNTGGTDKYNQT